MVTYSDNRRPRVASEGDGAKGRRVGARLSVASFKKKKRTTKESSFEDNFALAVKDCGKKSWHISSRERGWPDRYVVGGYWFELKSLDTFGITHDLKPEQIAKLNELHANGDKCFYCAKYQDAFILVPWADFKEGNKEPIRFERYHYRTRADITEALKWIAFQS